MLNDFKNRLVFKKQISNFDGLRLFVSIRPLLAKFGWAKLDQRLPGPLPKADWDSPQGPLPVSCSFLFLESKVLKRGEAEKCPHPWESLSGTPTAQLGGREMKVQCVPDTAPVFVCTLQR